MSQQLSLFEGSPSDDSYPTTSVAKRKRYSKTFKWYSVCQATYVLAGFTCQIKGPFCTGKRYLQCHHCVNGTQDPRPCYDRLFNERPGIDTIAVCGCCHIGLHRGTQPANDNSPPPDERFLHAFAGDYDPIENPLGGEEPKEYVTANDNQSLKREAG